MRQKYIELRETRDIGEIISTYFDFLKQNFKTYLNIFIRYNGLFIIAFLGISYLLITGVFGLISDNTGAAYGYRTEIFLITGGIAFLIVYLITALLNYSLAASYTVRYVQEKGNPIETQSVWNIVRQNLAKILGFVVLMTLLYIGVMMVGMILTFIPILGTLAYYFIMLGFTGWMGLAFMVMIHQNKGITDSLGEGWTLLSKYFWKTVLSNIVISLLLGILMSVIILIPGIFIGLYTFHAIDSGQEITGSILFVTLWIIGGAILMTVYLFNQSLIQFINGIVYFSVYEETYNEAARERIDNIGL